MKSISAVGVANLGPSFKGRVSTKVIRLTPNTLVGGSFRVVCRIMDSPAAATWLPISYRQRYLNGAVADDTFVSTAITGESVIEVNAAGLEIGIECTAITSGAMEVTHVDLDG